jgi:hypothetical protein
MLFIVKNHWDPYFTDHPRIYNLSNCMHQAKGLEFSFLSCLSFCVCKPVSICNHYFAVLHMFPWTLFCLLYNVKKQDDCVTPIFNSTLVIIDKPV